MVTGKVPVSDAAYPVVDTSIKFLTGRGAAGTNADIAAQRTRVNTLVHDDPYVVSTPTCIPASIRLELRTDDPARGVIPVAKPDAY